MPGTPALSLRLERAMRRAAIWHRGQARKRSDLPYVQHVFAVALLLDRLGFGEDVVIAGLLHDAIEDTEATLDDVRREFGEGVAALVADSTERKLDESGRKRPWEDRKRDHLAALESAPVEARAVVLADKLHNLVSMRVDLEAGEDLWSRFNAPRDRIVGYYETAIARLGRGDPRLEALASECRDALEVVRGRDDAGQEGEGGGWAEAPWGASASDP